MDEKIDFNRWNFQKKALNEHNEILRSYPYEKEVRFCFLGKNIGNEQNGGDDDFSRPVLIIKKFNNSMFWVLPLSTKQKDLDFYYNFTDPFNHRVSVVLAQLRFISIKRVGRRMYRIPDSDFGHITSKLRGFLSYK